MSYQIDLIDKTKEVLNVASDYQLSKKLEISHQVVSNWRTMATTIDPSAAAIIGQIVGRPTAEIMVNIERRAGIRRRWKKALEMSKSAAACAILSLGIYAGSVVTTPATADTLNLTTYTLYAMLLALYLSWVADFSLTRFTFNKRIKRSLIE